MAGFLALTLPLMPVQAVLNRTSSRLARHLPHWYHRHVCRVIGLRIQASGVLVRDRATLIIANHSSWLDVPLLSAIGPVSFVAKREVASWPFVATLARLQRTVFVDRERRLSVGESSNEILARLEAGDTIVLFAEGTSSDGNRVLPFKTSLFGAVKPPAGLMAAVKTPAGQAAHSRRGIVVQTVTIAYARRDGLPLTWAQRRGLGYYGDIGIGANAWGVLTGGPLQATVTIGPPLALDAFKDRKDMAQATEAEVRAAHRAALRGI